MTRRLRLAVTAFGTMVVPACVSIDDDRRPVPITPPGYRIMPGVLVPVPKPASDTAVQTGFAEARPDSATNVVPLPTFATDNLTTPAKATSSSTPATAPAAGEPTQRALPKSPTEPKASVDTGKNDAPNRRVNYEVPILVREPKPDADGVIKAPWPVIKNITPIIRPVSEPPPPSMDIVVPKDATSGMTPIVPPPPSAVPGELPPNVIGSSIPEAKDSPKSPKSPTGPRSVGPTISPPPMGPLESTNPTAPSMVPSVPSETRSSSDPRPDRSQITFHGGTTGPALPAAGNVIHDSPLIQAIRGLQAGQPDRSVDSIRGLDPASQQILLALLPPIVAISEQGLGKLRSDEVDSLLEQISRVPAMLRNRASLQVNNVRLCRGVHNFGHVEPHSEKHIFRPGELVYLYAELANYSCQPQQKDGYVISIKSRIELIDVNGKLVWPADPKEGPDVLTTPPNDYYRSYRLEVPPVAPGLYTLALKVVDRPTGRETRRTVTMRIGAR